MTETAAANRANFARAAAYYTEQFTHRRADVDFWAAQAASGGPVLEVGCGTGRILLPIAAGGHRVTGVDHSPEMLEKLRRSPAFTPVAGQVDLVVGDLTTAWRALSPHRQVFFTFGVFQYVMEGQIDVLAGYRAILSPAGRVVLDCKAFIEDPKYLGLLDTKAELPADVFQQDGLTISVRPAVGWNSYDQVITEVYEHEVRDSHGALVEAFSTEHVMRSYTMPELVLLAESAGFTVGRTWRGYGGSGTGKRYILELLA